MRKLIAIAVFLIFLCLPTLATVYYVDFTTGSDADSGLTEALAWKTLAKVNASSFSAGDSILLKRGETWYEQLTIPRSGSAGFLLTFGAYGTGNAPLISAADHVLGSSGDWADQTGNVWRRALATECQHVIFNSTYRGVEDATPDSQYEWDWVTSYLYVYSVGNPTGYYSSIEAGQRNDCIYSSGKSYVTIDGIDLRGGNLSNCYFWGGSYTTIKNSVITFGTLDGVRWASTATYGTATNCTISYVNYCGINALNTVTTGLTLTDNLIHHYGQDPAYQYSCGITGYSSNTVIARNTIHSQPAATTNGYGHGIYWARGTGLAIYQNEVYGILNGNGIKVKADGGSTDADIYRNYSHHNVMAGILIERAFDTNTLTVRLYYNILTGSHYGIILDNTYAQTFNAYIYNNVCYKNIDTTLYAAPYEIRIMNNPTILEIKNNIFFGLSGTTTKEMRVDGTLSAATINYNCYYLGTFYYGGASRTWTYWTATLGFDANGMVADPAFVNAGGSYALDTDFKIPTGSPVKDVGANVNLTEDYFGNSVPIGGAPDIGIHEWQGTGGYPEINITDGTNTIGDGGTFDFGSKVVNSNTNQGFTLQNLGDANLTLSGTPIITITGTNADQFSVQLQPTTPVAGPGSTTFTLRFSPTSSGVKVAAIAIGNNDADENPYNVTFTGIGASTIYINQLADPGGNGTTQELTGANCAFQTIAAAQAAVTGDQHGNNLLIARGTPAPIYREQYTVPAYGTTAGQFTFGAYGTGDAPIIDGTNLMSTWTPASGSATPSIAATNDDYYVRVTSQLWDTSVAWGVSGGENFNAGFRFQLNIPQGATISAATLTVKIVTDTDNVNLKVYAHNVDNSSQITDFATWNTAQSSLTAAIDWDLVAPGVGNHTSPELKTIFQTIVNRSGWAANNYIQLFCNQDGTANNMLHSLAAYATSGYASLSVSYGLNNVWKATLNIQPQQVFFNGTKGNKQASFANVNSENDWYWASNILYVYSTSDPDTAYINPGIEASVRDYCVVIGQQYIDVTALNLKRANINGLRIYRTNTINIDSLVTSGGALMEGFQNTGDWSLTGTGAAVAADTTHYTNGTQSIKLSGTSDTITMTKTVSWDLSGSGTFLMGLYFKDGISTNTSVKVELSSTADFSKNKYITISPFGTLIVNDDHIHRYTFAKSDFSDTGSESWSNTFVRIRLSVFISGGGVPDLTFTDFYFGYQAKAVCLINFDDGHDTHYSAAWPILQANQQAATAFINSSTIGGANKLTTANLQTLYAAGWDIGNHGTNHADWTLLDAAGWASEVEVNRTYIINLGCPRGADFAAYPGGTTDDTVLDRMQTNHFLGRDLGAGKYFKHPSGLDEDYWRLNSYSINGTTATNQGYVDTAIAENGLLILYTHEVDEAHACTPAVLTALSNYLKTKEDDILTLTYSEYLAGRGLAGIRIYYNIIQDCGTSGIAIKYAGDHSVFNNVLAQNGSYGLEMHYNKASLQPRVKNNVFWDNGDDSYQIYSTDAAISTGHLMDNNLYYDPDSHTNVIYWEGTTRATLAAFVAATGWEDNGVESDPTFTNSANGDFTLQPGSPCINAGVNVGLTRDFDGNPVPWGNIISPILKTIKQTIRQIMCTDTTPDIGAYEYSWSNLSK